MNNAGKNDLWSYRRAVPFTPVKKTILLVLIIAGLLSIIRLFNWWFREEHVANLFLYTLLSLIFWWGIIRTVILWVSYLHISVPEEKPAPKGYRVAIFTTSSPGEPLSMFEKTLAACANITYPHTTYLLDDTRNPRFREVAKKYGVYRSQDGMTERALFVIDGDGIIRWSYVSPIGVNPGAEGILRALESIAPSPNQKS